MTSDRTFPFQITASIVLYENHPSDVRSAIESFLTTSLRHKLYVIDNSPQDTLQQTVRTYPKVEYIYPGHNCGYGAGNNIALRLCLDQAPYHLVMNPDIRFNPGQLESIFSYMEENPDVGLVMPTVRFPNGHMQHLCKLLPTPFDLFSRRFLSRLPFVRKRNHIFELRYTGYDQAMNVPYLSGCFMFMRTRVLREVGLFDERFFLYLEDTDLSRRIHAVARTMYYPGAEVIHLYSRASYKNFNLTLQHLRSSWVYFNKWGWFIDHERRKTNRQTLHSHNRHIQQVI